MCFRILAWSTTTGGEDAIFLQYRQDIGAIKFDVNNRINTQTYGHYAVCDFDGDAIDDLFLLPACPGGSQAWASFRGDSWRCATRN